MKFTIDVTLESFVSIMSLLLQVIGEGLSSQLRRAVRIYIVLQLGNYFEQFSLKL